MIRHLRIQTEQAGIFVSRKDRRYLAAEAGNAGMEISQTVSVGMISQNGSRFCVVEGVDDDAAVSGHFRNGFLCDLSGDRNDTDLRVERGKFFGA